MKTEQASKAQELRTGGGGVVGDGMGVGEVSLRPGLQAAITRSQPR